MKSKKLLKENSFKSKLISVPTTPPSERDGDDVKIITNSNSSSNLKSKSVSTSTLKSALRKPSTIRISIVEKREKQVSHCWKNLQILTYVMVIVSGIASAKSMGDVIFMFSNRCILSGILNIMKDANGTRWITFDNFETVRWGEMSDCDFCQFFPVASLAVAGSLATFFTMCGRGGDTTRNLPQPWRMVPVAFFFNFIFVIISCVHVAFIYNGFSAFCRNIRPINEASKVTNCAQVFEASVANMKGDLGTNVTAAQFFSVFGLCGWLLSLIVIVVRCATHADFLIVAQRDVSKKYIHHSISGKENHAYEVKFDDSNDYSSISSSSNEYSTPLSSIN